MTDLRSRLVRVAVSFVLVGISVACLIRAELGVAPYDVLNTGVADIVGIRVGIAFLFVALFTYGIGVLLGGRAGWASLVGTFAISPLIELSLAVIPESKPLAVRVPLFVAGVFILCLAVCLAISSDLGPGPGEVAMLGLVARGMRVAPARWVVDGTAVVVGSLLGGAVGVGTLVFAFGFGPMVAVGLRVLRYEPPVLGCDAVIAP